jgi:hypothetical protein
MILLSSRWGRSINQRGRAVKRSGLSEETVIDQLISESKSGEPLMKSATLRGLKLAPEDIEAMTNYIVSHSDHTAYHLLFALRGNAPDAYRRLPDSSKARVLCDALTHLMFLNDWGDLDPNGSHDGEAALALLELGKSAADCLAAVLDDSRPAPLYGSETAATSSLYQYRRKDFAYRYLSLISGREPAFDADPKKRDAEIERLKAELSSAQ